MSDAVTVSSAAAAAEETSDDSVNGIVGIGLLSAGAGVLDDPELSGGSLRGFAESDL